MTDTLEALGTTEANLATLKVLLENSFDSIVITNATTEGEIIYANKAFETLTGYEPSEVIGKTPRILQGEATDETVIDRLTVALKSGTEFEGNAINYKKNGTAFNMFWRVVPIKVDNKVEAWAAIQREGAAS